ncbi:MAG: hypothetical protein CVV27_06425 [Candidatus Melainabacteria bacterium HGW-Melainabacteria-1]|nr:MAG: hypothetical protein CVV27_06425 [Candidatus Melainabacteria bacterium HGW-Melainabacteria-1]
MALTKDIDTSDLYLGAVKRTLAAGLMLLLSACQPPGFKADGSPEFLPAEQALIFSLSPLGSPPPNPSNAYADHPQAAAFGQQLFYDPRLSADGRFSCASCHNPAQGWSDARPRAVAMGVGARHSPTLWNVAHQRWLFWDGRADSLWAQAIQPLESLLEMGRSRTALYQLFRREQGLNGAYAKVFGPLPSVASTLPPEARPGAAKDPLNTAWNRIPAADRQAINRFVANLGKSFEAFERKLVSGESPFDRFARGLRTKDPQLTASLDKDAQFGLRLFIGRGQCILCHSGSNFSDGEFHNLGLPALPGQAPDEGRFGGIAALLADPLNGQGSFSDLPADDAWNDKLRYLERQNSNRGEFKTPTLREVAQTAPYMHDGRFASLEQVLAFYDNPGLHVSALGRREDTLQPLKLSPDEIRQLTAFLKALSSGPPATALTRALP